VAKEKNPLCANCKKEIDLEELTLIEQAMAFDGEYTHPNCNAPKEKQEPITTKYRHTKL
jgi:hypothetical protein